MPAILCREIATGRAARAHSAERGSRPEHVETAPSEVPTPKARGFAVNDLQLG